MKFPVKYAPKNWFQSQRTLLAVPWILSILWLVLVTWLAFLWNLGNTGLVDETEPLFAEAARQMTVTGDWITPYFNGETRFDKPILIYWLMAIAYKVIGVNEWAARLPSALSAIALTGLGFYTLRFFGFPSPAAFVAAQADEQKQPGTNLQLWISAGLGAGLIALNLETIVWARTGVSDMLLTGCMDCALLAFFLGYAQPSQKAIQARWYIAFYVLIALAVLTKGPVGIVLPGLIVAAFLLYMGNWREVIPEMRPLRGMLIMAAIALPWYIAVTLANGDAFTDSFFGYHNIDRFTSVVNRHSAPWYFYFLVVLLGFAPWSIYLPMAIARLRFWQRDKWVTSSRSSQLGLFALFWFAGIFGFFTIAITKLPSYVLPLMPAAAILIALLFSDQMSKNLQFSNTEKLEFFGGATNNSKSQALLWSGIFNLLFLVVFSAALLYLPNLLGSDPAIPNLHELIQKSGLPVLGSIIWGATALGVGILLLKRQWHWLWSANLIGFLAFLIFWMTPTYLLIDQARQLPLRQLAAIATQVQQPHEDLLMIGFEKPSLVFYTRRPIIFLGKPERAKFYIEAKLRKRDFSQSTTESSPSSFLILSQPGELNKVGLQPNQYQNLGSAGAYQLIRVSKQAIASREF